MFETVAIIEIDTPLLACQVCGALVSFDLRDRHVIYHELTRIQREERSCA